MLSKELEFTLNNAFKEAREKRYEFMTVESSICYWRCSTTRLPLRY